jgi:YihY family inner membrane protein
MNTSKKFVFLILRHPIRFLVRVLKGFKANQGILLSGAVAYYTLLSIIPLFTLFLIGLSHLVDEQQLQGIITNNLEMIVPGYSQPILNEIENFLKHREVVGTIGVLFLIFFSSLAFTILENAMSVIFFHRVQILRRHFMVSAILPYLYILLLGIGLLMITVISGALRAVKEPKIRLLAWTLGMDDFAGTILYLLGIVGMIVVLTSIYMVMPVGKIRLRHALVGGITGAALWEVTRHILIWYFSTISLVNIIYGSLATLIVALLSLEAGAMILLLGAQVIAEYERFDLKTGNQTQEVQGMETFRKQFHLPSLKKKHQQ